MHFPVKLGGKTKKMRGCRFTVAVAILLVQFTTNVIAGDSFVSSENECVYTLYIQTGSVMKAGTDSKISVTLGDASGRSVWIPNVGQWGLMGPNHDYFETGNLDIFSGRGPCIGSPICRLNLTSDGSGSHHGWFCDTLYMTSTGPHRACRQSIFYVDQWLASDAPPFELSVVLDGCHLTKKEGYNGPFVVDNSSRHIGHYSQ